MILSLQIALTVYFSSPVSVPAYFGNDFKNANQEITSFDSAFTTVANDFNVDKNLMKAIVFPEFLRYSYLSDLMESFVLEQIYTRYGSSAADFSIGHCQMKPSFAEDLEYRSLKNEKLKPVFISVAAGSAENVRRQRVERLKNIKWQATYVAVFIKMAEEKFNLNTIPPNEKLLHLAVIYNRGMNIKKSQLAEYAGKKLFPNGNHTGAINPYAYAQVAWYYYKLQQQ
jgi:hypothetical protein